MRRSCHAVIIIRELPWLSAPNRRRTTTNGTTKISSMILGSSRWREVSKGRKGQVYAAWSAQRTWTASLEKNAASYFLRILWQIMAVACEDPRGITCTICASHSKTPVLRNYFWELRSVVSSSPGRGIFANPKINVTERESYDDRCRVYTIPDRLDKEIFCPLSVHTSVIFL